MGQKRRPGRRFWGASAPQPLVPEHAEQSEQSAQSAFPVPEHAERSENGANGA